ncbi:unnamed protein product [Candida verbasci]|uniref:Protein arginine methyltransferase NDUFAF7 n=1 Tax=Candida verbasci TaxID=1227364 RepID=A0A9W4TQL8_9ASCO|nr:unnamed protein product [Candida verbasci]
MIRSIRKYIPKQCFHSSVFQLQQLPPHKDGLYFGKYTKEEYEDAKKIIQDQISKLETEIKGDYNIRENIDKFKPFPETGPSTGKISNLTDFFKNTIKLTGPISLSAFMRQCLTHPEFGYYTTRDPLNLKTGDFITSPEISSVFGEMLGIWYFTTWQSQNRPKQMRFIEFGPGKGTLINDILLTFNKLIRKVQGDVKIKIIMIEASNVLRKEQWKLLCEESNAFETTEEGFNRSVTKWNNDIVWMDTEKSIKKDETGQIANYIISHEFFDALPIKSFIKQDDNTWRELVVENSELVENKLGIEGSEETKDFDVDFHLTISPKETPSSMIPKLSKRYKDLPVGTRIEICPDAELYIMKMVQLLNENNGAVLVVDYGTTASVPENSLRGIYKHKFVSPFYKPGDVDLSIDVDFGNLVKLTESLSQVFGPLNQGDWLHNIGIGYRIDQLIKSTTDESKQDKIYESYKRLTDDEQMGKIYKFLALLPKGSKKPIGF